MTTAFRSIDPSTGQLVGDWPEATPDEVESGLALAADAFRGWSATPLADRATALHALATRLRAERDRLAVVMAEEIGKPITQGRGEVDKCAWACEYAADHAAEWLAPESVRTEAETSYVRHDPLGPVLAIMPWNFPFWQLFRFGASALAAGDTIVMKHAPNAPRCALALAGLFDGLPFPRGALVNLFVDVGTIEGLIADDRIAAVTLTGSTRAGRSVASAAGRHLKPSVLELGGSDPFVVLADADLDAAAKVAAQSRLQNNGQSCIAAKRFIVEQAVADGFVERFRAEIAAAVVGDPRDPATTMGPMARRDLRDTLHGQVAVSLGLGAARILGGELPERDGFWYPPTLLTGVTPEMPVWSDEVFGPVAAVRVVRDAAEALTVANASRYGLGATVFTADRGRAEALSRELRVGAVFVNALVRSDPRLPFGGVGDSGWGRELGQLGMRSFTLPKTVWVS
ncbi:MAG: NAD-dependent succinate-semialdehyde dehydrogenase [Myxococcota bacterium]